MTTNDLLEKNRLADALLAKMERIKELYDDLLTPDHLEELGKRAWDVAHALEKAQEVFTADDFPGLDQLKDLADHAGGLSSSLEEANDTYQSGDLAEIAGVRRAVDAIAGGLADAAAAKAELES